MKNAAKCDTWCELQNPVNHRVFERKLRPKPLGQGHVCLGVTHNSAPNILPKTFLGQRSVGVQTLASRALLARLAEIHSMWHHGSQRMVDTSSLPSLPRISLWIPFVLWRSCMRPQVRWDYPLSLSISISGGKETYKDSPSNGERTGKSPA